MRNKAAKCLVAGAFIMAVGCCQPSMGTMAANKTKHKVKVTAYTNIPSCADSTPNITASGLRIKPVHYRKLIVLSPDLAKKYRFGDKFKLVTKDKILLVEYQDIMAKRSRMKIDLLLPSKRACMKFGVEKGLLVPVPTTKAVWRILRPKAVKIINNL